MSTLVVAVLSFFGFIAAYHTYGKWLARKVFGLDKDAPVPSQQLRDDIDYVPTKKEVIFGHHFTSIAGTGPIVGPAIAVFWGWLPALLWVVLGSIFIGAVHDFGALVVSLRNRGQTLGEVAGRMINKRAKVLFLLILFFALTIVLAIFGLVIAIIFANYPETVLSVWIEIPLAVAIGFWVYKKGGGLLVPSLAALAIMYGCIYIGAYHFQIDFGAWFGIPLVGKTFLNAVVVWSMILFVYCFIASVLPVWTLLQPRDYINSHQLILALGLLVLGLLIAGGTGKADIASSAPAINSEAPADAPPIWPFLFITIACGACSGFHCLVSSGTSSKQVSCETDAQYVAYGSMLLEGALAVIVIIACCAGIGMGKFSRKSVEGGGYEYQPKMEDGKQL
ncbi:MAG: carbon starvation CstA family protein, partial [Planctomycetota bacterium]|nr:carbon starvation CstA family protein [Planctomycetota bacterium]